MEARFLNITTVSAERLARWESWLSPEKRQRVDCLKPKQRLQSVCGDGLAREMLAEQLGIAPEDIVFTYNENGKPLTEGAFFSVSHSHHVVGCAVSDRPVGLDIERIRPVPERLGRALEPWERTEEFWRLWTRREAALKCRGDGLGAWKNDREEGLTFTHPVYPAYAVSICEETV